jgi:glycosyltransferase involved in cell wall biosynthesis
VFEQDYPKEDTEIIAVDDGSTDSTLKILRDLCASHTESYVYHQSWKGISAGRNLILSKATGQYIVWVDAGMTLSRDYVKKQVQFMERNPKVGICKGTFEIEQGSKLLPSLEIYRHFSLQSVSFKLSGIGGATHRTEAIKKVGGFDEKIKGAGEDIDIASRMVMNGWLISETNALFSERFKETWKDLWRQNYWYGMGGHLILHKNCQGVSVFYKLPPVSFIAGVMRFLKAFRAYGKPELILLPVHSVFRETAWLMGFVSAHTSGYGHREGI